jgi:hypothetical protein
MLKTPQSATHATLSAVLILNLVDIGAILSGFPHGPTSLYAMILGIGSYLLATSSTFGCYLATTGFVLIDESPRQYFDTDVERMAVGLFSFEDRINASELACKMYSRSQIASFDAAFTVAQAFGIMANVMIGSCVIIFLFLSCGSLRRPVLKSVCVLLCLGGIFQALTLLIFASDALCQSCEVFFGTGISILCTVVTFINAIVTYRIPAVDEQAARMKSGKVAAEIFKDEEGDEEQHQTTHQIDASVESSPVKDVDKVQSQTEAASIHGKRKGRVVKTIESVDKVQSQTEPSSIHEKRKGRAAESIVGVDKVQSQTEPSSIHEKRKRRVAETIVGVDKVQSQTEPSSIHGKRKGRVVKTIVNLDGSHTVEKSVLYT